MELVLALAAGERAWPVRKLALPELPNPRRENKDVDRHGCSCGATGVNQWTRVAWTSVETQQRRGPLRAVLSAMRIPQWIKNALLFVAPGASGHMFHADVLDHTILAFAAFSLVASGVYLVNDLLDIEDDRRHPTKRLRAIASGDLQLAIARILAVLLFAAGFALPLDLPRPEGFYIVLLLYVVESLAYSLKVKTVAVLELGFVASGFFLRSYAGAVASHIPVSQWFLVVVTFGALFLVIGKRSAELRHVGTANRVVLRDYSPEFLHSALTMAAGVVVTTYCLWAFDTSSTGLSSVKHDVLWIRITVVPVVLAVLYVVRGAESPAGESPEDLLLKNRVVQGLALVWLFFLAWGTYL